jgi:hypothetical protein
MTVIVVGGRIHCQRKLVSSMVWPVPLEELWTFGESPWKHGNE